MAAVLACTSPGREAFLSHRSAASLWGLLPPTDGYVEVVVRGYGGRGRRPGIRLHRSEILESDEIAIKAGIPATSPARTLFDLDREPRRRRLAPPQLRRATRNAHVLGYEIGRNHSDCTRSELEVRFLELCRLNDLPRPEVNVLIGDFEVDFLWRERGLIVETDGYRYHRGQIAFEDDRNRDFELRSSGYEVQRFTFRQVTRQSQKIAQFLRDRLASLPGEISTAAVDKSPGG